MRRSIIAKFRWGGGYSGRIQFAHPYEDIISVENLLAAWREFVRGKRKKRDVQEFQYKLMDNILALHRDLKYGHGVSIFRYKHGGYKAFKISDPKPRDIHKASVRDRLVHRALYRKLYPFFGRTFIFDSYSCREGKGTHKALRQFRIYASRASSDHANTVWVLKCDIRKFFASIDHEALMKIVRGFIPNDRIIALIAGVVSSFDSDIRNKGLPLGNLTSQLFVNIYMNEFDQFVKNILKIRYYIRYADDFVVFSQHKNYLLKTLSYMEVFLRDRLMLEMHPRKVFLKTLASGVDFLGWVHFLDHRVLRTATKRRMFKRILKVQGKEETAQSYLGLLSHGNAYKLRVQVESSILSLL